MSEGKLERWAKLGSLGTRIASLRLGEKVRGASRRARRERAASEIADTLSSLKGAAMKAGQQLAIAASALDLPEEVQSSLGRLHKDAEPVPWWRISQVLEDEWDADVLDVCATFEKTPLGTASLAQAHAATLPDGSEVVVKVLHPGVLDGLEADLMALRALVLGGRLVGRTKGELRDVLDEVEERLREEVDYLQEAANIEAFDAIYRDDPRVRVPRLRHALCTEKVLVMDRIAGQSLKAFARTAPAEVKARAGSALGELFFEMAFHHRLLHADPHPGNYLFTEHGRIGLLDFGCVKRFDEFFLARYARVVLPALEGDRTATLRACRELGAWEGDDPRAGEVIWRLCDRAMQPWREGPVRLDADPDLIDDCSAIGRELWRYPEVRGVRDMLYLHRTLAGLFTLARPLGAVEDWGAMLRSHLGHAIAVAEGTG